jgi:hypothetical protein
MMASERSTVTETTGPHAPDDPRDPHGIFDDIGGVDAFLDEHDADTLEEALASAEEMPSTTPAADMRRCRACGSRKCRKKKSHQERENMKPESYRCEECGTHQDDPALPLSEVDPDADWTDNNATHTPFEWVVDARDLDEQPDPGLHPELPDLQERDRDEAARWVVLLSKPWSDDDGLSIRETATRLPFGRGFVNDVRQEWRRGELDPAITAEAYLREVDR